VLVTFESNILLLLVTFKVIYYFLVTLQIEKLCNV